MEARRFSAFVLTGGVAAACNVGTRILLSRVMRYEAAVALAYLAGMLVAFELSRRFVFNRNHDRAWHVQLMRFGTVNCVSFLQVWLVSVGLLRLVFPRIHVTWRPETVAHLIGVASPILVSYYAHKHFSFRPATAEADRSSSGPNPS